MEPVEIVHRITLNAEESMLAARALRHVILSGSRAWSVGEVAIATQLADRLEAVS